MVIVMSKTKEKPYAGGRWTEARLRSFIMSAIRRAAWPVKYDVVKSAFVREGANPATGRKCKLHKCSDCCRLFPAKDVAADHIEPVVPVDGKWGDTTEYLGVNWNELLPRLFCEEENYQVLCHGCHSEKTEVEKRMRKFYKDQQKE